MKIALVCGAGGFIGHHLVSRLKSEGYHTTGVDKKYPLFSKSQADRFLCGDLSNQTFVRSIFALKQYDEVYQLAAEMGGAGYIFSGEHDAKVMHESALINLNVLHATKENKVGKIFFSSSACVYNTSLQESVIPTPLSEDMAYPANPDHEYGWEKLFSERLYQAYARNYGVNVRIARFHTIFGEEGSWNDGKEKVVAALCRKIAMAKDGEAIEIWGDGKQTRSFLYIDECIEGIRRLMSSGITSPVNIGSDKAISINQLACVIMDIAGKNLPIKHIQGALGVRGRVSDNTYIKEALNWQPNCELRKGLEITYKWIRGQVGK